MFVISISLDYLFTQFPVFAVEVPSIYKTIAQDKSDSVVLEVPLWRVTATGGIGLELDMERYYQTIHQHRVVNGFVARAPGWMVADLEKEPLYTYLSVIQKTGCSSEPSSEQFSENIQKQLRKLNIGYIIINKKYARSYNCFIDSSGFKIIEENDAYVALKRD